MVGKGDGLLKEKGDPVACRSITGTRERMLTEQNWPLYRWPKQFISQQGQKFQLSWRAAQQLNRHIMASKRRKWLILLTSLGG